MNYSILDVVPEKENSSSLIPLTTTNEVILFTVFGVLCLAELVFAFFEIGVELCDGSAVFRTDLVALIAECLAQLVINVRRVNQLQLAFALVALVL